MSALNVSVNPGTTETSAKNTYAIECFGAIEANKGATISAASDKKDADAFCSGAVVRCKLCFPWCWSYIDTHVSGSPILQNGKIVGAVTHVFVNDPTKGMGYL